MEHYREVLKSKRRVSNLKFQPLTEIAASCIEEMVTWENDPEIRKLIFPLRQESSEYVTWTKESLKSRIESAEKSETGFLILDGEKPIGEMSYRFNFPLLLNDSAEKTAWISITIGDKSYWGKGVGKEALNFLETKCFENGAKKIELGVFEFNKRARDFYQHMGYQEIGRVPQFVYYNERKWSDIRMEKTSIACTLKNHFN
ncbi:MAG: GNAT family N-acetyltransferase [Bacteriovoracaceae bacterium]